MKKAYHLSTCTTCKKIIQELPVTNELELQDVKKHPVTEEQLAEMYALTQNYKVLFNKRAQLYKTLGLKEKNLSPLEYKKYILEHYTFLNRPVFILDQQIFIGNSSKTIAQVHAAMQATRE